MGDDLQKQIEAAQAAHAERTGRKRVNDVPVAKGMGLGFRMATEFVVATLVGAALGWGLDILFGTKPWMFIVWLMFGFAAGVMNVVRVATDAQNAPEDDSSGEKEVEGG